MKNKLLIIIIPIIILLLSFKMIFFSLSYFSDDIDSRNVIDYLKNKVQLDDKFSEKEKLHLQDVKSVIISINLIFYFLLIVLGLFLMSSNQTLKKDLINAGITSFGVILGLSAIVFLFFSKTFIFLHMVLFQNNLWMLPPNSLLLNLFSEVFFYKIALFIFLNALLLSILLILAGLLIHKLFKW